MAGQLGMDRNKALIVRESFLLPFRGSEIWALELDGLGENSGLVQEKFLGDIRYARRPSTTSLVALHLKDTGLTKELIDVIVNALGKAGRNIKKLAFIGVEKGNKQVLSGELLKQGITIQYKFFEDYEKAKEWLIPSQRGL